MLIVTTLIACILAALFLRLSFGVIRLRRHHKVGLGSGGVDDLERAIRAQANFAEYVPIALILMACLELNGAPLWLIAILGIALVAGRVIHAKGINQPPPHFSNRVIGMKFTITTLIMLVVFNLAWLLLQLWP
jgi:uncharacterized membrane protein YecN with MAPEG domain